MTARAIRTARTVSAASIGDDRKLKLIAMRLQGGHGGGDLAGVGRDHVMPHGFAELAKPPGAHLCQHRALHRDRLGHHHVVGAHPVGRHQQEPVALDLVDVAHLAAGDPLQRQIARRHQQHCVPRLISLPRLTGEVPPEGAEGESLTDDFGNVMIGKRQAI